MKKLITFALLLNLGVCFSQTQKIEKRDTSGKIEETGFLKSGVRDSIWTSYFPDGTIKAIAQYKDGVKVGTWKTFHQNGSSMFEISYYEGRKKSGIQYDGSGNVIEKKEW